MCFCRNNFCLCNYYGSYYGCCLMMYISCSLLVDYVLISVYYSTEFWSLSSDSLSGYIKAQAFSILDSLLFELGHNGSGLGLMILHKKSLVTQDYYLQKITDTLFKTSEPESHTLRCPTQGEKKVSFTACQLGKLKLECTTRRCHLH